MMNTHGPNSTLTFSKIKGPVKIKTKRILDSHHAGLHHSAVMRFGMIAEAETHATHRPKETMYNTHTPHWHTHCVKTRSDTHTRIDLTAVKGSFFFSLSLYYNNSIRDLFKKHKITVRRERWLRLILLFVGTLGLLDSCDNLIDLFQCWKRLNDPMGFVSSFKTEEEKLSKTATSCISRRTRLSR
jgi:hypothetical protein